MYTASGIKAYAQVSVESAVMSASPHQLIEMLFDGANSALVRARLFLEQGDVVAKGEALSKAINIIDNGLKAGLDQEKGGEIATNLSELYDYMIRRLLQANLRNDAQAIEEVEGLLSNIAEARKQISPKASFRVSLMTSTVEFINRWQRIALLSQSLLELAQRGEWDLLLQQEVSYLQSIETVMEKQTPPGITRSIQDMVAGYIKQTLDNEQLLKGLLQQRLDELSSLIGQSTRQKSLNNAYGRLSGMLLVPDAHGAS